MALQNEPVEPALKIDLHGYHPKDIVGDVLAKIVEQAWEKGATRLCLIHGHGRARGRSPGFYNTKTGYFGLALRRRLRHSVLLRRWIKYTTLDCRSWGSTTVKLKANPAPSRTALDLSILPAPRFPDERPRSGKAPQGSVQATATVEGRAAGR